MCAHTRAILLMRGFLSRRTFTALRAAHSFAREERKGGKTSLTTRDSNPKTLDFFDPFYPVSTALRMGMHRFIAPDSKACQLRFSKPPQRIAESAFSLLFSCFSSLTTLPLHYENETKGLLQRHREINYSSLRLADVTNFNEVQSASMFN